ncbi:MAG: hypothetical protein BWY60_00158 [Actinobacteria bacterium ADurb.Bin346]|nr:MAG: hypothetical protein BWY60_00158 [Actinobacteria bacterium ADurb.Bin346]
MHKSQGFFPFVIILTIGYPQCLHKSFVVTASPDWGRENVFVQFGYALHPMNLFLVFFEVLITRFPLQPSSTHFPTVKSSLTAFFISCAISFLSFFRFIITPLSIFFDFSITSSFVSSPLAMPSMSISSSDVISGVEIFSACFFSTFITATAFSEGTRGLPFIYPLVIRFWIMVCLVALVPRPSSSIFSTSFPWVYLAGGFVCLSSSSPEITSSSSPFFKCGINTSSCL